MRRIMLCARRVGFKGPVQGPLESLFVSIVIDERLRQLVRIDSSVFYLVLAGVPARQLD